jgi:hypothetical protein
VRAFFPYGAASASYSAAGTETAFTVTAERRFVAGGISASGIVGFMEVRDGANVITGLLTYDGYFISGGFATLPAEVRLFASGADIETAEPVAETIALLTPASFTEENFGAEWVYEEEAYGGDPQKRYAKFTVSDIPDGTYTLVTHKKNHTSATVYNIAVSDGAVRTVYTDKAGKKHPLTLYAGDMDPLHVRDGIVNEADRSYLMGRLDVTGPPAVPDDLIDNGTIDIYDLSLQLGNFNRKAEVTTLP